MAYGPAAGCGTGMATPAPPDTDTRRGAEGVVVRDRIAARCGPAIAVGTPLFRTQRLGCATLRNRTQPGCDRPTEPYRTRAAGDKVECAASILHRVSLLEACDDGVGDMSGESALLPNLQSPVFWDQVRWSGTAMIGDMTFLDCVAGETAMVLLLRHACADAKPARSITEARDTERKSVMMCPFGGNWRWRDQRGRT